MAQSYGMITIVDNTDLGQLSFYLTGNTLRHQQHDVNTGDYFPTWTTQEPFIVSPNVYYDGTSIDENTDSRIYSITWYHTAIDVNNKITVTTTSAAEYISGKTLKRTTNLTEGGRKYIAVLKFRPVAGDSSLEMEAVAELELTYNAYGLNGNPAKALQVIGDGSHFIYQYTGDLINNVPITLTVQKQNIDGVFWECDGQPIYSNGGIPTLNNTGVRYSSLTLPVVGKRTDGYTEITALSNNFSSNKEATFKVIETSSGSIVTGGFSDYYSIYKIDEALPGTSTYSSYLDNDNESISVYNNVPDLTNANSTLYIEKGGVNDISNWEISITATTGISYRSAQGDNISGPYKNKVIVEGMSSNTGQVTFTATKEYELSTDTVVDSSKDYFTRTTTTSGYNYTQVVSPSGNPSQNSYYEHISIATVIKKFSLSKNPSLISHSLRLTAVNSNRTEDNIYTPANITVGAITRTGGAGTIDYTAQGVLTLIIHPIEGNAVTKTDLTPPQTLDLANLKNNNNINIGPISYIEVFLGGTSAESYNDAEDKQIITIGSYKDGQDSWQVNLRQQFDSIQTSIDYKVKESVTYEIPFEVFKGINLQNVHYPAATGTIYPTVTATSNNSTIQSLLRYYNNDSLVTSGTGVVNKIKFTVVKDTTTIGESGTITLTFNLDGTNTVEKIYTYQAVPEAIGLIDLRTLQDPSDTFENQSGINYGKVYVLNGTTDLTNVSDTTKPIYINSFKWYYYDASTSPAKWKVIKNTNTGLVPTEEYYSNGIRTGYLTNGTFQEAANNTTSSKVIQINGSAIDGYGAFKVEVNVVIKGNQETYSEIITFKDVSDPIQVNVQSTLGLQLVNGQGVGAIYVRTIRDNIEIDSIVSDNFLGADTVAPTGSNNNSPFTGKTGWIYFDPENNYEASYYYRNTAAASGAGTQWTKRTSTEASYSWEFRDSNNEPITTDTIKSGGIHYGVHSSIKYIVSNSESYKPQFVYLDKDVVDKKITATVKVEI